MKLNKILILIITNIIIILHQIQPSYSMLHPVEFLALQSIKKSLQDMPGSTYLSSWDFTSNPCNFAGVFCVTENDSERVVTLNLGDPRASTPGLAGRLDPSIGKLTKLVEFTVVPGRIMGDIPGTVSELKQLRFFAVSRNFISGEIPAAVGGLTELRMLDLSYNRLTGNIPWGVGSLPALTNVVICHNRLSGSIPVFSSQTLTRLDLKHNNLTGSIPPGFLPNSVQYLSLSWNRFLGRVDYLLPQLTRLNYLDLSFNLFSGPVPGSVFGFPITSLQLQRNLFLGPVQPYNEVAIQTVDLSHNMLYGEVSPLFSTVQNLYLNNNRFTGSVPRVLMDRLLDGTMKLLYLQHNFLTAVPVEPTSVIPMSSTLCLQYKCVVPPVQTECSVEAGTQKTRPTSQCAKLKG
ncbi:uncharacterized protein LOC143555477 [Bidens hawaiensis]|uniref:uncharacterized protein LOC143555477 n=1 Tax=Bidens hawaiensis TaxID=980011 RepID=UPI00404B27A0